MNRSRFWFLTSLVLFAAVSRIIPHPPNFAPITAVALFGAATLASKRLAILTPLLALFVSDLWIEAMHRAGLTTSLGIYPGMWVTYTAFLLIALIGLLLRRNRSVPAITGATLAGSCVFYLVTNFPGLYGPTENLYPRTAEGIIACYTAALPFLKWTLLGDAVYTSALFGALALAERRMPALRESPEQASAPA